MPNKKLGAYWIQIPEGQISKKNWIQWSQFKLNGLIPVRGTIWQAGRGTSIMDYHPAARTTIESATDTFLLTKNGCLSVANGHSRIDGMYPSYVCWFCTQIV